MNIIAETKKTFTEHDISLSNTILACVSHLNLKCVSYSFCRNIEIFKSNVQCPTAFNIVNVTQELKESESVTNIIVL